MQNLINKFDVVYASYRHNNAIFNLQILNPNKYIQNNQY